MGNWRDRESDTQARSRVDNESTARLQSLAPTDLGMASFRCECGDVGCLCAIWLTSMEYESVRSYATHFAIAPDHENPESEQLVEEHERFTVVEMVSRDAARLARKSDPRHWGGER